MTALDWASSGGVKIKRAKKHVADFAWCMSGFFNAHPYRVLSKRNAESGALRFFAEETAPVPLLDWAPIAADATHNLHSALDFLWHRVWGGSRSYFPFFDDPDKFEARFRRVKEPAHKAAMKLLREIKPYKGGNDLLCTLHEIDVRDKHEMLMLVAGTFRDYTLGYPAGRPGERIEVVVKVHGFVPLKGRTELSTELTLHTSDGSKVDVDGKITPDVAFDQGEILEGQSVIDTLHHFTKLVDGIAKSFLTAGLLK